LLFCSGCSIAETPFARTAGDYASLLSASAITIEYAHTGKLPSPYARVSLMVYRDLLIRLPKDLSTLDGAPGHQEEAHLTDLRRATAPILADPCLDHGCDWRRQVAKLREASDAFDESSQ